MRRDGSMITPAALLAGLLLSILGRSALAQVSPVYVDDSPRAWELFQLARDQVRDNAGEAVRLYQELLDDYAVRLIPVSEHSRDYYTSVRRRVRQDLRADERLLERYRLMASPEARRLLEAGDLDGTVLTRPFTEPALEALLCLAQRELDDADFRRALLWLDEALEHPDFHGERAAHGWYMRGVAAHYLGLPDVLAASERALPGFERLGRTLQEHLDALTAGDPRRDRPPAEALFDQPAVEDFAGLVDHVIWSLDLTRTVPLISGDLRSMRPLPGQVSARDVADLSFVPTVVGGTVYVNQGYQVVALDRYTGREIWKRPFLDAPPFAVLDRQDTVRDINVVTISGDSLVTISGQARATERPDGGMIVCLSAATGELRWARNVRDVGNLEERDDVFPYGAPVVADGMAYVLVRKVSPQFLTSCYVVAYDLYSGRLQWWRHIASSGGLNKRVARPFSTIIERDGDLYVATGVGAIARLSAATGEPRWVQRFTVPIAIGAQDREPWELSTPVVTAEEVVALQPDERRIVVLHRETGDLLTSFAVTRGGPWSVPRYLLANEHSVFAIGDEIRAFRTEDLDFPVWRLPRPAQQSEPGVTIDPEPLEIVGRVQLAQGALIVPTPQAVLIVDDETGTIRHRIRIDRSGNPMATESQLFIAGPDHLDAYMSIDRAEAILRDRITANPADPHPALSLLQLGARIGRLELSLEAAALAAAAIDARPTRSEHRVAQRELFQMLLSIHRRQTPQRTDLGERLYAMLAAVAADPSQRVEHLLAYGDWLSERSLDAAVEAYQTVLSEPGLAVIWRAENGTSRPSGDWAALRIGTLIERRGAVAYAPQAHFAELRVQELLEATASPADAQAERLLAVAAEFPFAESSIQARLEAARLLLERQEPRRALAALTPSPGPPAEDGRLAAAAVAAADDAGWRRVQRDLLRPLADRDVTIETPDGPRTAAAWLASISTGEPAKLPNVGTAPAGNAETIRGRLVVPATAHTSPPAQTVLLLDDSELKLVSTVDLRLIWTCDLGEPYGSGELLHDEPGRLVLWLRDQAGDGRHAVAVDSVEGDLLWKTPEFRRILGDPSDPRPPARIENFMPSGEPFDPSEVIPIVHDDLLLLVRRTGDATALELADGQTIRWRHDRALEQVFAAARHDAGLVLAGTQRTLDQLEAPAPMLIVLDPRTGVRLFSHRPLTRSGVVWAVVGDATTLLIGASEGIEALDVFTGRRRWASTAPEAEETRRCWVLEAGVLLENPAHELRLIDPASAEVSRALSDNVLGDWSEDELRSILETPGGIVAHYSDRVIVYEAGGAVRGADSLTGERRFDWVIPAAGGMIVVDAKPARSLPPDEGNRWRNEYPYQLHPLSWNGRLRDISMELPPLPSPLEETLAVDGWLLLSTAATTVAIPMESE